jgi:repressor LexA
MTRSTGRRRPAPAPTREPLTARQSEVLDVIRKYIRANEYPPTRREIAEGMGIRNGQGVVDHLKALRRKGYITMERYTSRGIRVLP